jgi:hypothetical protein
MPYSSHRFGSASPTFIDVEMMDANPISHFLSPTILPDDDLDDFVFDLDAGIEDAKHPRRSAMQSVVSPSTLDFYSRGIAIGGGGGDIHTGGSSSSVAAACQLSRSPSSWSSSTLSDTDSDVYTDDDDNDENDDECFVSLASAPAPPPGTGALGRFSLDGMRGGSGSRRRSSGKFSRNPGLIRPRSMPTSAPSPAVAMPRMPSSYASGGGAAASSHYLGLPSPPPSPGRARSHHYQQQQQQQQQQQAQQQQQQQQQKNHHLQLQLHVPRRSALVSSNSWREPSPDVWSITEEAEDEDDAGAVLATAQRTSPPPRAGRTRKTVRFVLTPEVI